MEHKNNPKVIPSLSGIRACISNAERLLNDSKKASIPTSAALLELSLEEISKGWWLMLKLVFLREKAESPSAKLRNDSSLRSVINASGVSTADMSDEIKLHLTPLREMLMTTDNWNSLRDHNFKLRFMKELKGMLEFLLPIYLKEVNPNIVKKIGKEISPYETQNLTKVQIDARFSGVMDILDGLDNATFTKLDDLKNDGFYVEYKDGEFIQPADRVFPVPKLYAFVDLLIRGLRNFSKYYNS